MNRALRKHNSLFYKLFYIKISLFVYSSHDEIKLNWFILELNRSSSAVFVHQSKYSFNISFQIPSIFISFGIFVCTVIKLCIFHCINTNYNLSYSLGFL